MSQIAGLINVAGSLTPHMQLRVAARPPSLVGPGGVLQPPGQQDYIGPSDVIRPFTVMDLLNQEVLDTLEVWSGEVGALSKNVGVTQQLIERIRVVTVEFNETVEAVAKVFREFDEDILRVKGDVAGAAGSMAAALKALAEEMRTGIAALVADAQGQLDRAHAELLTLTDPEKIAAQGDKIRQLILERYEGELRLIQQATAEIMSLAGAWGNVAEVVQEQIAQLRLSGFGPPNPSERLALARGRFGEALAAFREGVPTPVEAGRVMELVEPVLQAASEIFTRPSMEFRAIFDEMIGVLQEIEGVAVDEEQKFRDAVQILLGEGNTIASLTERNTLWAAQSLELLRAELAAIFAERFGLPVPAPLAGILTPAVTLPALQEGTPRSLGTLVGAGAPIQPAVITQNDYRLDYRLAAITPTFGQAGGFVERTGLAYIHRGEQLIPEGRSSSPTFTLTLATGSIVVNGADNPKGVSQEIMQALERWLRTGRGGRVIAERVGRS